MTTADQILIYIDTHDKLTITEVKDILDILIQDTVDKCNQHPSKSPYNQNWLGKLFAYTLCNKLIEKMEE